MVRLLIVVNLGVYAAMAAATHGLSFTVRELLEWGGNLGLLSLHGQAWRLLTATFLHASPIHIAGNMMLLWVTGGYLERKVGAGPLLCCYLVCGVAASWASASGHPDVVSIGASGAIAGLVGIVAAFLVTGHGSEINKSWLVQTVALNAVFSLLPHVDWLAHAAGFGAGLACGLVLPRVAGRRARPG